MFLQQLAPPHDRATAADGHGQPFVRVEGDRVGALQAGVPAGQARVECPEAAVGAVHVQPQALVPAEVGEVAERIDGTGLHAPRVGRDQERPMPGPAVGRDRRPQAGQVDAEVVAGRDLAGSAEPEREGGLLQAGMTLGRHVHGEPGMPLQALGPDVPAVGLRTPVPRDLQAVPVRVRAPAE
jgi:hypothetical protein